MKCIEYYIKVFQTGFAKELQGVYEFNEELIFNEIMQMSN